MKKEVDDNFLLFFAVRTMRIFCFAVAKYCIMGRYCSAVTRAFTYSLCGSKVVIVV